MEDCRFLFVICQLTCLLVGQILLCIFSLHCIGFIPISLMRGIKQGKVALGLHSQHTTRFFGIYHLSLWPQGRLLLMASRALLQRWFSHLWAGILVTYLSHQYSIKSFLYSLLHIRRIRFVMSQKGLMTYSLLATHSGSKVA